MKAILFLIWSSLASLHSYAQNTIDTCPKPLMERFVKVCDLVETQDSYVDEILKQISCVNKGDDTTAVKRKVREMWHKYRNDFKCDREGFNIKDGNIVKLCIATNYITFLYTLVQDYDIDINFPDPADGKNVLDFTKDEIDRLKIMGGQNERISQLKEMYDLLVRDLNAKHSSNYKL